MLNALAVVLQQILLDLTAAAALFVERNANLAIGSRHGPGLEAGVLSFNVKEADLAEVKQLFVVRRPVIHAPAVHVMGQVIDKAKAAALGPPVSAVEIDEVDVVNRGAFGIAVDQVQDGAANAANRRQLEFHGAAGDVDGLRALGQRPRVSGRGVMHAKGHTAGARAVLLGVVRGGRVLVVIDNEIDIALTPQVHVFGFVARHRGKAQHSQHRLQCAPLQRGELNEFKAVKAHGVGKQIAHAQSPAGGERSYSLTAFAGQIVAFYCAY